MTQFNPITSPPLPDSATRGGSHVSPDLTVAPTSGKMNWRRPPIWVQVILYSLLIYFGIVIWAQVRFRSYRFAVDYALGDRVQAQPALLELGPHRPGDRENVSARLRNHGSAPIQIVGALVDCSCLAVRPLPATIEPGRSIDLPISIRFGVTAGPYRGRGIYLTNDPAQKQVVVELRGEISPG